MDVREYIEEKIKELLDERIRRVRINPSIRRARRMKYRRNKRKIKMAARKRRRSPKYKQWKRKFKIRAKRSSYVKRKFV